MLTKISREPVEIKRALDDPKLSAVLESPDFSRARGFRRSRVVNHVPLHDRACGINEKQATSGAKRVMDAAPEPVGMALGNMRKPEREEDDVVLPIWLPAEEVVNPKLDVALAGLLQLRQSEVAHLRRAIDSDDPGRRLREPERPLTCAVSKLENLAPRRKIIECRVHSIELETPLGIELLAQVMESLATEPLVVLASASPIVGELLTENWRIVCHNAPGYASGPRRRSRITHGTLTASSKPDRPVRIRRRTTLSAPREGSGFRSRRSRCKGGQHQGSGRDPD